MGGTGSDDDTFLPDADDAGRCFGCGPANEAGLRLRFRRRRDGGVETLLAPGPWLEGVDGVLHGGIQATVLDEVMAVAAQLSRPPGSRRTSLVTAELSLRYLRPVPIDADVRAVARVVRVDGSDVYVHGEILGPGGDELTTARARWRLPRR